MSSACRVPPGAVGAAGPSAWRCLAGALDSGTPTTPELPAPPLALGATTSQPRGPAPLFCPLGAVRTHQKCVAGQGAAPGVPGSSWGLWQTPGRPCSGGPRGYQVEGTATGPRLGEGPAEGGSAPGCLPSLPAGGPQPAPKEAGGRPGLQPSWVWRNHRKQGGGSLGTGLANLSPLITR